MDIGRIDIHSHLLPGIDDGCRDLDESIRCARVMTEAGYTHSFVTPHVWPNLPKVEIDSLWPMAQTLQEALDAAGVPLKVFPGGELNLNPQLAKTPHEKLISYGLAGKFALMDFWADRLPDSFWPTMQHLQSAGLTVIIAHPERSRAIQDSPHLADEFQRRGLLLQGNLQCLSDPPHADTYRTMRRFMDEDRYSFLGSDAHRLETMSIRINGLNHAIELLGEAKVDELTRTNPMRILQPLLG